MSTFTIHTSESAPEGSREALGTLEQNLGFIPNLAATIGGSPVALAAFVAMQSALRRSSLTPAEREIVGITVSPENGSPYSMAAHSTFAERVGWRPMRSPRCATAGPWPTRAMRRSTRSPPSSCRVAAARRPTSSSPLATPPSRCSRS